MDQNRKLRQGTVRLHSEMDKTKKMMELHLQEKKDLKAELAAAQKEIRALQRKMKK